MSVKYGQVAETSLASLWNRDKFSIFKQQEKAVCQLNWSPALLEEAGRLMFLHFHQIIASTRSGIDYCYFS